MTEEMFEGDIKESATNIVNLANGIIYMVESEPTIPDPYPDSDPPPEPWVPDLPTVTMRKKAPLMEVERYDGKGKPVLRAHKYGTAKLGRIRAKEGKKLFYVGKVKSAQGIAFRLYSGQMVDGEWLTETNTKKKHPVTKKIDKYFYILKRLVKV